MLLPTVTRFIFAQVLRYMLMHCCHCHRVFGVTSYENAVIDYSFVFSFCHLFGVEIVSRPIIVHVDKNCTTPAWLKGDYSTLFVRRLVKYSTSTWEGIMFRFACMLFVVGCLITETVSRWTLPGTSRRWEGRYRCRRRIVLLCGPLPSFSSGPRESYRGAPCSVPPHQLRPRLWHSSLASCNTTVCDSVRTTYVD